MRREQQMLLMMQQDMEKVKIQGDFQAYTLYSILDTEGLSAF